MPRGADPQREREYEKLVDEFHSQHRYEGREEEVASRIINKQRAEHGETKDAIEQDERGESQDRDLPIADYDKLDIDEITARLESLTSPDVKKIKTYEHAHSNRKTLLEDLERRLV